MSYLKRGLRGVIFLFAASIVANLLGYATRAVLARSIPVEDFGLFYALIAVMMFLMSFGILGFGTAIVKFVPKMQAQQKENKISFVLVYSAGVILSLTLVFALLQFFLAPLLAQNYFQNAPVTLVQLFALILVLMVIAQIVLYIFRSFQDFGLASMHNMLFKAGFFVFVILFTYLGFSRNAFLPTYAFLAGIAVLAIVTVSLLVRYRKRLHKPVYDSSLAKDIRNFSFVSFLSAIGVLLIAYVDTLMLTYFQPLDQVGIYNAVLPTVMVLGMLSIAVRQVLAPMTSELWTKQKKEILQQGIQVIRKYLLVLLLPLVLTFMLFPSLILNILFGSVYAQGSVAMQILSVGILFFSLGFVYITVLQQTGKEKQATKFILIAMVVNIFLNLLLIPSSGIVGAGIATTLSYGVIFFLSAKEMKKVIVLPSSWVVWTKIGIASVLFVDVAFLVRFLLNLSFLSEAIISLLFAGMAYVVVLCVLKMIRKKEITRFIGEMRS
tara:strand:- start:36 stop:1517 length:1482 start_codon:yes stop_codon:yes gene_type:complete